VCDLTTFGGIQPASSTLSGRDVNGLCLCVHVIRTMSKNEDIEQQTVLTAIEILEKTAGFKAKWKPSKKRQLNWVLNIRIGEKLMKFLVEVKLRPVKP
jgi:hypothetical protein